MSYQVLARKWRPRFFREMVGQEHVLQALINALDHNRLHHAYLFTGTRGVGKTSIARILAKCLNCESGVSSEPCGQCSSCIEINQGSFVDLIEVDAASRTKVEDTRDLLDNVQYAPSKGRYKVYLIDEVHMLSTHSFNALLKTLEEPPEHVKFLLATTDPQKLPATILSRCLQFHLKNMVPERIVDHLEHVLGQESVEFESAALWSLARSADGSMRDALSLTDQAIAFGSGKVLESQVRDMLGSIDQQTVYQLAQALAQHDAKQLLQVISDFSEQAPDYASVLDELLMLLHRMTIAQVVPDAIDNSLGDQERVLELAQSVTAQELQLFYQMGIMAKKDFSLAPDLRSGLEMAVLRMLVFRPEGVSEPPTKALSPPVQTPAVQMDTPAGAEPEKKSEPSVVVAAEVAQTVEPIKAVADESVALSDKAELEPVVASAQTTVDEGHNDSASALDVVDDVPEVAEVTAVKVPEPEMSEVKLPKAPVVDIFTAAIVQDVVVDHTVQPEIDPQPLIAQADFSALTSNDQWLLMFDAIPFNGLLRAIAAECILFKRQHDQLFLCLDMANAQLYNERHAQQISAVLSDYFAVAVTVDISIKEVGEYEGLETPAIYLAELRQAAFDGALQELQNDAGLQHIVDTYSAKIAMNTVKVIHSGE